MTDTNTETMTRTELIADAVEADVAEWGEKERAGLVRRHNAASTMELRADRQMRLGETVTAGRRTRNIARGCLDSGHS
jgi:hypothetical protein